MIADRSICLFRCQSLRLSFTNTSRQSRAVSRLTAKLRSQISYAQAKASQNSKLFDGDKGFSQKYPLILHPKSEINARIKDTARGHLKRSHGKRTNLHSQEFRIKIPESRILNSKFNYALCIMNYALTKLSPATLRLTHALHRSGPRVLKRVQ